MLKGSSMSIQVQWGLERRRGTMDAGGQTCMYQGNGT